MNFTGTRRGLIAILAASALATLDLFIVNLAFPTIKTFFPEASAQLMSWVLNGYTVMFAALLIPAGTIADRIGRKRLFITGMLVFALGGVFSVFAWNPWVLIAGRVIQGAGAACVVPTSLALALDIASQAAGKQMIALWAAAGTIAGGAGPVLGGFLASWNWRFVFVVGLVLVTIALLYSVRLPSPSASSRGSVDVLGIVLLASSVGVAVTAVTYVKTWGVSSVLFLSLVAVSLITFAVCIWRCRVVSEPLIQLGLFRIRRFRAATVGMWFFYVCFTMMLLGGSMFLIQQWEWSSLNAGIGVALWPLSATVAALTLARRPIAADRLAFSGSLLFVATAVLWLVFAASESGVFSSVVFFVGVAFSGFAAGLAQTGFLSSGTHDLDSGDNATGMGVLNTARQIGSAFGTALLIAIVGAGVHGADYRLVWMCSAGAAAGAAVSALALRRGVSEKTR